MTILKFKANVPEIPLFMLKDYNAYLKLHTDYPTREHEKLLNDQFETIRKYVVANVWITNI